ncbi:MAG: hypothetical protein ACI8WB_002705 [Phenylobacterium sp.]|jgi:hypothetical protein
MVKRMVVGLRISLFLLSVLLMSYVSAAEPLWQQVRPPASQVTNSPVQRLYQQGSAVVLDKSQLRTLTVGDTLLLPLNLSKTVTGGAEAIIKRIQYHANGSQTWFAVLNQLNPSNSGDQIQQQWPVVITASEHSFFIRIESGQGVYLLRGLQNRGWMFKESLLDQLVDTSKDDFLRPPKPLSQPSQPSQRQPSPQTEQALVLASALTSVQVDILVVYTTGANDLYGGDAQTRINHLIAVSNQIYTDSGVLLQINALAMDEVSYSDSATSDVALNAITNGSGTLSGIETRRVALGADMVVFMRPYANDGSCGIAWVNGNNGSVGNSASHMYSHTSINCSDYVNAHEMGHNMGLWHSRVQDGSGQTFTYGLGYGVSANFVTVMAYPSAFSNASKIYKFSSPSLDCNGLPCGIDSAASDGADAVLALNTVRNQLAGFYQAASADSDGDGVIDSDDAFPLDPSESVDTDGDGTGNNADPDDDNDGVLDGSDAFPLDATESVDTDGDGTGNNADTDDDNDGILDVADPFPLDPGESVDTDGDGIGNNADSDDDNDGVLDVNDNFPLDATESIDTDGDGIGNNADSDDDNDGVSDSSDAFPLDASESIDTDSDGTGNNADPDDDNDNVLDVNDSFPLDASESVDTDGDGTGNNADTDDDNDGVLDFVDAFPLDASESVDSDGDGIGNNADPDDDNDGVVDANDVFPLDGSESVDTDGDGIGNNADRDDDNDTVLDANDAFPLDASESVDTDGDGTGNNADADDDNDGVIDTQDTFPLDATEFVDTDSDGTGNNADTDDDGDGVLDINDAFPLDITEYQDTDGDGIGNNKDTDDDNDGVEDDNDAFPLDATESIDTDSDGIGNNADTDDDNDGVFDIDDLFPLDALESLDTDNDGIGNNVDLDDDNDGFSDVDELAVGSNPLNGNDLPSTMMPWLKLLLDKPAI